MEDGFKVSHYFEWEDSITGGQKQSVKNQRKMLESLGIEYTTEPDLDADILHLNNMGPKSVYYAWRARKMDVKVVVHSHQTAEDFRNSFIFSNILARPMRPYLKLAYGLADLIICPSDHNRDVMESYTDADKVVISNGFDHEKIEGFEELREEYLEKYDLEPPVVFCLGHVIKRKGVDSFVETAREMEDTSFAWFGFLNPLGEGQSSILQGRETKNIVDSAPENCVFTGYIDDVRGGFAAGDIFFFPTRNENEGMALLESMAAGKPVVVRDINTFNWLEHEKNCLKASEDFEEPLKRLIEDEELRERLGENAREKSKEFRLENLQDKLLEAYQRIISKDDAQN